MFRRRRPLARAAMVGGAAYYAGKKGQQSADREYDQEARLQELEAQQSAAAPPPPPAAAPAAAAPSSIDQLQKLAELKAAGVLTDAEFEAQKQKILGAS